MGSPFALHNKSLESEHSFWFSLYLSFSLTLCLGYLSIGLPEQCLPTLSGLICVSQRKCSCGIVKHLGKLCWHYSFSCFTRAPRRWQSRLLHRLHNPSLSCPIHTHSYSCSCMKNRTLLPNRGGSCFGLGKNSKTASRRVLGFD